VTSIGTAVLAPQIALGDESGGFDPSPGAQTQRAGSLLAARDAQIPDLAETSAGLNQLQSLASASSASPIAASLPVATPPTPQQQTQAQPAAAQPPLAGDYYADGDDAG